jgi:hypothetical protein
MNQDDLDALHGAGFEPHDRGVWHRPAPGDENGAGHYVYYNPGRKVGDKVKPWHVTKDPEEQGRDFSTLRGMSGALSNLHHFSSAIPDWTKFGAKATPGQSAADKWLADNDNNDWMREREGDPDEGYTHWEPSENDYTYRDFGDAAGQSFNGDEAESHILPGSHYHNDADWETGLHSPSTWSPEDIAAHDSLSERMPATRQDNYADGDDDEPPQHEQDLADLGFNWQHRGDPNTTPVGEHQEGEYVRHQHDPEGRHVATHTMYRDPNGRSDQAWHLEHNDSEDPNFAISHTTHRFPSDAISYYHHNAENALLPQRGYESHRGRSGVVTHWTRVDTDPHSGNEYHHEISNQPYAGENGNHQGWLGQTHSSSFPRDYGYEGTRNQSVNTELADVVREHDRIGRGLHPGGSQDYRTTREELLSDPSVARLGMPHSVSDNFYRDGKVGMALWALPHPNPVDHERPHINAEATYNWDKGGYDFKYTHDGQQLHPNHPHFPAGAPVHVPGRQTSIPLESAR